MHLSQLGHQDFVRDFKPCRSVDVKCDGTAGHFGDRLRQETGKFADDEEIDDDPIRCAELRCLERRLHRERRITWPEAHVRTHSAAGEGAVDDAVDQAPAGEQLAAQEESIGKV